MRYAEHCGVALVLAPSVVPEAAVEAGVEALLRECDLADADMRKWVRVPVRNLRAALTAALPHLTATPSATREEVEAVLDEVLDEAAYDDGTIAHDSDKRLADRLLARFTITPKEDR